MLFRSKKREKKLLWLQKKKKLLFIKKEKKKKLFLRVKIKNIRALKSVRVFSQEKKKSVHVKIFVYYNIRSYFFLIFLNILILMIVYIIKSLGNLLLGVTNQEKKLPQLLVEICCFFFS